MPLRTPGSHHRWDVWRENLGVLVLYLLLTLLAWGLFAFDTGLWQDDVNSLRRAVAGVGPLAGFLAAGVTTTRRFKSVIYSLAARTDDPVMLLHLVSGLVWLGQGLLADRLARRVLARRAWVGLVAGGLTLCATADLLTGSLVGLGYQCSVLAFLGATILLVRWCRQGGGILLASSCGLLATCLWTSDGLVTSLVLIPVLLWTLPDVRRRRLAGGILAWGLVAVPYLCLFAWELMRSGGYAREALLSLSVQQWVTRTLRLFVYNFTPWRWLEHPLPFATVGPDRLVPLWVYAVASLLGTVFFLVMFRRLLRAPFRSAEESGSVAEPRWRTLLVLLVMTFAVNGAFAMVQLAEVFYRTHLVSRIWSSLLVAGVTSRLVLARSGVARLAPVLPALFVACGLWGGVERQDFFLASWRSHRAELASILEAAPGLSSDSVLVLVAAAEPAFLATEASYLATSWAVLLYRDPTMDGRTVLWSPERHSGCRFASEGLACWEEGRQECFLAGMCPGVMAPYEHVVLLRYSSHAGGYALVQDLGVLTDEPLPEAARRYDPHKQLVSREISPWTRSLLRESRFLGHLLGAATAGDEGRNGDGSVPEEGGRH